jgi:asparagine synthase (glutamine-hydrolysing)
MSAFAGIYNFDGALVDPELISALGSALEPWGPDGGDEICAGSVGMAYRAFHTTRESRQECQPLISGQGHILTWDGRIDNREELISLLRDLLPEQPTDADIAMVVCRKWGADGIVRIIGDFALAWIDKENRTLLLARDAIGTRPLCYHVNQDRIFWSSSMKLLLDLSGCCIEINEEYIGNYLAFYPQEPGHTPYTEIFSVKPGHVVIIKNGQMREERFWGPESIKDIRYKRDAEYEEHFRELIFEAVRSHLRYPGTVYGELSGGMDSTTVVSLVDLLIKEGKCEAERLRTTSHFSKDSQNADEGKFIRYVEDLRGEVGVHLRFEETCLRYAPPESHFESIPSIGLLHYGARKSVVREMAKDDARVVLSGQGGDQILWALPTASPELADLLYEGRYLQLHYRIKFWSNFFNIPYLQTLWRQGVMPLMPYRVRSRYQNDFKLPEWLNERHINLIKANKKSYLPELPDSSLTPGRRMRAVYVLQAIDRISAGCYEHGELLEIGYPLLHRRLIEFLLSIPFDQVMRDGEQRSIQRRALDRVLPDKVLRRKYKGSICDGYLREFRERWEAIQVLFDTPSIFDRGYIKLDTFRITLEKARHGASVNILQLLRAISLELWLQSMRFHYRIT